MSTQILLVRHAIAEARNAARWPDDRKRPLSLRGRQKFARAARGLARWLPKVDAVFTSPLTRARQTARLLEQVAAWPDARVSPALVPYRSPPAVLRLLAEQQGRRIALVGHEPGLSRLLATCLGGSGARPVAEFKKGGAALLEFAAEVQAGRAVLRAFVPPRVLRRMGRQ